MREAIKICIDICVIIIPLHYFPVCKLSLVVSSVLGFRNENRFCRRSNSFKPLKCFCLQKKKRLLSDKTIQPVFRKTLDDACQSPLSGSELHPSLLKGFLSCLSRKKILHMNTSDKKFHGFSNANPLQWHYSSDCITIDTTALHGCQRSTFSLHILTSFILKEARAWVPRQAFYTKLYRTAERTVNYTEALTFICELCFS